MFVASFFSLLINRVLHLTDIFNYLGHQILELKKTIKLAFMDKEKSSKKLSDLLNYTQKSHKKKTIVI